MTKQILLVSSSVVHGFGYLEYCEEDICDLFGDRARVLFVPFALQDHVAYTAKVRTRFAQMGYAIESVHESEDPRDAIDRCEAIFIGGGNTFRLLKGLYDKDLMAPIRKRVTHGAPYLGASAGSNVAGPTIKTTNDMPICQPSSFDALGLVPFQLNPHYLDADPAATHMGETRAQRLNEFHEMNATPVLALREGSHVRVDGAAMSLRGLKGACLFRRGESPVELLPGAKLDHLLVEAAARK